jgi:ComEC/Rec2-related protein
MASQRQRYEIRQCRGASRFFRQPGRVEGWRSRVHRCIIGKVHDLWPERLTGLMDAIVIGEETFLGRSTRVDFQRSGTYHVPVASGMNVSILAMFTLWSLRRLGLGDVLASACAIALILAYAVSTKEGSPVARAALMFAIYLCTRLIYRDRAMLNALGLAAIILLIADPRGLFGASFQMTFLCVALVAGVGIPILERTIEPYSRGLRNLHALAYDRALPRKIAQFRNDESLVMRIVYGQTSALLEADAERPTEQFVAGDDPRADVLKVAHHGSAISSTETLLAAVKPRFALISVGARNVYHHPRAEVLRRLQNAKVITYRTGTDGATRLFLDGTRVTPEATIH